MLKIKTYLLRNHDDHIKKYKSLSSFQMQECCLIVAIYLKKKKSYIKCWILRRFWNSSYCNKATINNDLFSKTKKGEEQKEALWINGDMNTELNIYKY